MILSFDVNQQTVSRSAFTSIPRKGSREYLYLVFTFSDDWTDLTKTLYVSSETYSDGIIIEEGVPVQVPTYYTQQNSFSITLCGIKGNQFVPTNVVTVLLEESNDTWEEIAPDPESIPYQQLIAMVQKSIEAMHAPYINKKTKTWMQWSTEQNMFVDTGIVVKGQDGVSVTGASINTSGHLLISLSSGNTIDAGNAKGDKGDSVEIVDNLTTRDPSKALSAKQGLELSDMIIAHRNEMVSYIDNNTNNNVFYPTVKAMTDYVKANVTGVVDNLESEDTNKALSANMGRVLKNKYDNVFGEVISGNLFNKNAEYELGLWQLGQHYTGDAYNGYFSSHRIPVKVGDIIRATYLSSLGTNMGLFVDENGEYVTMAYNSPASNPNNPKVIDNKYCELTVPNNPNIAYFLYQGLVGNIGEIMVTVNYEYPNEYQPYYNTPKTYLKENVSLGAAQVVDNLESENIDKALSANMGKVLNEKSINAFKTLSAISDTKMVTGSVISIPDVIENTYIGIEAQDSVTKVFAVGENFFPMLTGENDEPFIVNENKGTAVKDFVRYVDLPITYPAGEYRLGAIVETSDETATTCMIRLYNNSTFTNAANIPVNKGEQKDVWIGATAPFNRIAFYSGANNAGAMGNSATFRNICLRYNNQSALTYIEYCGKVYNTPITDIVAHHNPLNIWANDLSALKVTYCKQKDTFTSPNPYYFDNNYLPSKVDTINALVKSTAVNGDSFIFITDQHLELNTTTWLSKNAGQSPALINYINQNTKVNKLFLGGDTFVGSKKDYSELISKAFSGETHYAIGNHEYDAGETDASLFYDYDINKKEQIGNSQRHYYYVDNPQQKIRYVVLNTYASNGSDTIEGWDEEQNAWLNSVALNVESGWGIIIIMHYMWSNAWKNDIQSAIDNYSGNGEIIAVFNGHLHHDEIKHTAGGTPCIGVTCDKYDATNDTLINVERTFGTITEQAFDVVVIDRTARKIHCVRIGAPAVDGDGTDTTNLVEIRVVDFKAQATE